MTTLYTRDAKGATRYWKISKDFDSLEIEFGVLGGTPQFKTKEVKENKSGRDLDAQMELEYQSLISKRKDKGYVEDQSQIKTTKTNAIGLRMPMLASKAAFLQKMDTTTASVQYKYDGHRCLIHNNGEELIAYSRNGKPIKTIRHITRGLKIPVGATVDGELYVHDYPLQKIASLVKREQPANKELIYQCYDVIMPELDLQFLERWDYINGEITETENFMFVPTWAYGKERIKDDFSAAKLMKYEGLIVRANSLYEDGKRSQGLVKLKSVMDEEFRVVDIGRSKDGWAVLECVTEQGKVFGVSAPGTMEEKTEVYQNRNEFLNKFVRVEYANLTPDGVPFHPVATEWRNKDAE